MKYVAQKPRAGSNKRVKEPLPGYHPYDTDSDNETWWTDYKRRK